MTQTWPTRMDHDTQAYWSGLKEGRLLIARCADCRHWIHPPRACCPACWSDDIGREEPSGKATLFTYLVHPIRPGGDPVVVGWAELVEQKRLLIVAPISGVTADTVRIGSRLSIFWTIDEGVHLPVLRQEPNP